jgi:hypothetical protein
VNRSHSHIGVNGLGGILLVHHRPAARALILAQGKTKFELADAVSSPEREWLLKTLRTYFSIESPERTDQFIFETINKRRHAPAPD